MLTQARISQLATAMHAALVTIDQYLFPPDDVSPVFRMRTAHNTSRPSENLILYLPKDENLPEDADPIDRIPTDGDCFLINRDCTEQYAKRLMDRDPPLEPGDLLERIHRWPMRAAWAKVLHRLREKCANTADGYHLILDAEELLNLAGGPIYSPRGVDCAEKYLEETRLREQGLYGEALAYELDEKEAALRIDFRVQARLVAIVAARDPVLQNVCKRLENMAIVLQKRLPH